MVRFLTALPAQCFFFACGDCVGRVEIVRGMGLFVLASLAAVLSIITVLVSRDGVRFGRMGMPWSTVGIGAGILAVVASLLLGPVGLAAGTPLLIGFSYGRYRKHQEEEERNQPV